MCELWHKPQAAPHGGRSYAAVDTTFALVPEMTLSALGDDHVGTNLTNPADHLRELTALKMMCRCPLSLNHDRKLS
jgi:hypothetical protein